MRIINTNYFRSNQRIIDNGESLINLTTNRRTRSLAKSQSLNILSGVAPYEKTYDEVVTSVKRGK